MNDCNQSGKSRKGFAFREPINQSAELSASESGFSLINMWPSADLATLRKVSSVSAKYLHISTRLQLKAT